MAGANDEFDLPRWQTQADQDVLSSSAQAAQAATNNTSYLCPNDVNARPFLLIPQLTAAYLSSPRPHAGRYRGRFFSIQYPLSRFSPASTVLERDRQQIGESWRVMKEMNKEVEEETSVDRELSVDPEARKEKWPSEEVVEQPEDERSWAMFKTRARLALRMKRAEGNQSVVKIVSDNPWPAARVAAILKSHDYDTIVKDLQEHRRSSPSVQPLMKNTREA
ncbi:hypothetical protein EW146_g5640 [Bondarzewia mesenterica]|uniref:Uncharacterized protein n=1 Tax=Bondarzewia mesenterica TaxID=1095465 RepID=A0A4S4LQX8_9AGAM|nr:hypothetical protein EW146_g5640 [Bondarzewia mesenterica]